MGQRCSTQQSRWTPLAAALLLPAAVFACGSSGPSAATVAQATQDCADMAALNGNCSLGLSIEANDCIAANVALDANCRAASHAYVSCLKQDTCAQMTDSNNTTCTGQHLQMIYQCPEVQENGGQVITSTQPSGDSNAAVRIKVPPAGA